LGKKGPQLAFKKAEEKKAVVSADETLEAREKKKGCPGEGKQPDKKILYHQGGKTKKATTSSGKKNSPRGKKEFDIEKRGVGRRKYFLNYES